MYRCEPLSCKLILMTASFRRSSDVGVAVTDVVDVVVAVVVVAGVVVVVYVEK